MLTLCPVLAGSCVVSGFVVTRLKLNPYATRRGYQLFLRGSALGLLCTVCGGLTCRLGSGCHMYLMEESGCIHECILLSAAVTCSVKSGVHLLLGYRPCSYCMLSIRE